MRCFVLVGGVSSRMGSAKADLLLGGVTFLDRVLAAANEAFEQVIAVTRRGGLHPATVETLFDDGHPDTASMFGLARALRAADNSEKIWLIGVDYPLIDAEVLNFLRQRFDVSGANLLVPYWHGQPQMLCAGYSKVLLPLVEANLAAGDLRLQRLLSGAVEETVDEQLLRQHFQGEPLWNVNRPEDLEEVRRLYE